MSENAKDTTESETRVSVEKDKRVTFADELKNSVASRAQRATAKSTAYKPSVAEITAKRETITGLTGDEDSNPAKSNPFARQLRSARNELRSTPDYEYRGAVVERDKSRAEESEKRVRSSVAGVADSATNSADADRPVRRLKKDRSTLDVSNYHRHQPGERFDAGPVYRREVKVSFDQGSAKQEKSVLGKSRNETYKEKEIDGQKSYQRTEKTQKHWFRERTVKYATDSSPKTVNNVSNKGNFKLDYEVDSDGKKHYTNVKVGKAYDRTTTSGEREGSQKFQTSYLGGLLTRSWEIDSAGQKNGTGFGIAGLYSRQIAIHKDGSTSITNSLFSGFLSQTRDTDRHGNSSVAARKIGPYERKVTKLPDGKTEATDVQFKFKVPTIRDGKLSFAEIKPVDLRTTSRIVDDEKSPTGKSRLEITKGKRFGFDVEAPKKTVLSTQDLKTPKTWMTEKERNSKIGKTVFPNKNAANLEDIHQTKDLQDKARDGVGGKGQRTISPRPLDDKTLRVQTPESKAGTITPPPPPPPMKKVDTGSRVDSTVPPPQPPRAPKPERRRGSNNPNLQTLVDESSALTNKMQKQGDLTHKFGAPKNQTVPIGTDRRSLRDDDVAIGLDKANLESVPRQIKTENGTKTVNAWTPKNREKLREDALKEARELSAKHEKRAADAKAKYEADDKRILGERAAKEKAADLAKNHAARAEWANSKSGWRGYGAKAIKLAGDTYYGTPEQKPATPAKEVPAPPPLDALKLKRLGSLEHLNDAPPPPDANQRSASNVTRLNTTVSRSQDLNDSVKVDTRKVSFQDAKSALENRGLKLRTRERVRG